jgi:hypothetical protein
MNRRDAGLALLALGAVPQSVLPRAERVVE